MTRRTLFQNREYIAQLFPHIVMGEHVKLFFREYLNRYVNEIQFIDSWENRDGPSWAGYVKFSAANSVKWRPFQMRVYDDGSFELMLRVNPEVSPSLLVAKCQNDPSLA